MRDSFRDDLVLPAGHPKSWGLLTAGTCLEGVPYPYPVRSHRGDADPRSTRNQAAAAAERDRGEAPSP